MSTRGPSPRLCPECRAIPRPRSEGVNRLDPDAAGYQLAASVTTYRLAIEEATSALRLGRVRAALDALERVEAPTRAEPRRCLNRVIQLPA